MPTLAILALLGGFAATDAPVTLRYQPPVGNRYVYSLNSGMDMNGAQVGQAMKMSQEATLITRITGRKDGFTTVVSTGSGAKMTLAGGPGGDHAMPAGKSVSLTMMIGELGEVRLPENQAAGNPFAPQVSQMMGGMGQFSFFPKDPVAAGSTWTSEYDFSKMFGQNLPPGVSMTGDKVPINFKLNGVKFQDGFRVAEIESDAVGKITMSPDTGVDGAGEEQVAEISIKIHSLILVDVATGMQVSTDSTTEIGVMTGAVAAMNETLTVSMKLKH